MSHILIVYESKYGQTLKIAMRVRELASARNHETQILHVMEVRAQDVERADLVVVLAPIFSGKHPKTIRNFLEAMRELLATRASAFYSVSGSAASTRAKDRDAARAIAKKLVDETCWSPRVVASIGGAIDFPKYNPLVRFVMKLIVRSQGGSTDTKRCHELTSWPMVESITSELLDDLETTSSPEPSKEPAKRLHLVSSA